MALVNIHTGLARDDCCALISYSCANSINVKVNIDAVCDCFLVTVFHHEVLVEETNRLSRRCCRESDQERIKIKQHLAPQLIN